MKILHVASFVGNIGDNASHLGLSRLLDGYFDDYTITRQEIRKFYRNYSHDDRCRFDDEFISRANEFDLVIIGGGGFLDYWVPESATGTTIDLDPRLVQRLAVPTLITSVGCMPHKAVPHGNIEKFRSFLDAIFLNPMLRLAVRNDGSKSAILRDIGRSYYEAIPEVLDHGFFFDTVGSRATLCSGDYVAINITEDQLKMNSALRGAIDTDVYYDELAKVCRHLIAEHQLSVVFVPHIYRDLAAISELLNRLDDYTIRERVTVGPCLQGDDAASQQFGIYRHSKLVLATRLHANVCSLAMGKPTLGLAAIDRVKHVHDSLGHYEGYTLLNDLFSHPMCRRIDSMLSGEGGFPAVVLEARREATRDLYGRWCRELGLL